MKARIIELHAKAPAKPAIGAACNGCGVCCALETCPLAMLRFLKRRGPCPALEWSANDVRYVCGLLKHPEHYLPLPAGTQNMARRFFARSIAAGKGCDSDAELAD